jgi:hypothetical protein
MHTFSTSIFLIFRGHTVHFEYVLDCGGKFANRYQEIISGTDSAACGAHLHQHFQQFQPLDWQNFYV